MIERLLLVAAGGAAGAVLRDQIGRWAVAAAGEAALGTLAVNVIGSALMGLAAALILERGWAPWLPPLLMTGVLGGFTTFSAFSLDAVRLVESGRIAIAGAYVLASVALSIGGLVAGLALGRALP